MSFSLLINRLSYRYNDNFLFRNFSHHFAGGQFHCLLGPSGVGKSTLLKLIAGLDKTENPQESVFRTNEGILKQTDISWMGQKDALLPWLNVMQNITLGYRLRGQNKKDKQATAQQASELLEQVGLTRHRLSMPDQLSGGMRQRAALVRTLLEQRPFVLMDEPLSALDAISRFEMQTLVANMTRDKTVIMVTHDPMEALRLGHHIHVLGGFPAKIILSLSPDGKPPRPPGDPELMIHYGQLMETLAAARLDVA